MWYYEPDGIVVRLIFECHFIKSFDSLRRFHPSERRNTMYYYNTESTASIQQKKLREIKKYPEFDLKKDPARIREFMRFFAQNPDWIRSQLQRHNEEIARWMSALDHSILDCEHVIALSQISEAEPERVQHAHDGLEVLLGLRILLKSHRQECLEKLDGKKTELIGERAYYVRVLHEDFGCAITIENNKMVIRQAKNILNA